MDLVSIAGKHVTGAKGVKTGIGAKRGKARTSAKRGKNWTWCHAREDTEKSSQSQVAIGFKFSSY